jgi:hypothetical protein
MFRFTIRDVLWLTVVVALAVGWAISQFRSASAVADYRKRLQAEADEKNVLVVSIMELGYDVDFRDPKVKITKRPEGQ